jgi:hypothetical protein
MKRQEHVPKRKNKVPIAPPGTFAIEPGDEMIALANSAPPTFTPTETSKPITSEMVRDILEPSPLTLRAAAVVMPMLRSKRVTPHQILTLLQEITKLRAEIHTVDARPDLIEYLRAIPKGPNVFDKIRALRARLRPLPKGEAAKLIQAGRRRKRGLFAGVQKVDRQKVRRQNARGSPHERPLNETSAQG